MTHDQWFQAANMLAFVSWVYLACFPFRKSTTQILIGISVAALAILYASLVFRVLTVQSFQQFATLQGVTQLLSVPGAALVGWVHYLAFDLLVGVFIANNAALHGISRWAILPCLLLTFMLGPVGLLLYLLIRWAYTHHYFAANFDT